MKNHLFIQFVLHLNQQNVGPSATLRWWKTHQNWLSLKGSQPVCMQWTTNTPNRASILINLNLDYAGLKLAAVKHQSGFKYPLNRRCPEYYLFHFDKKRFQLFYILIFTKYMYMGYSSGTWSVHFVNLREGYT